MLDKISQLSESETKGVTTHTAKDGGYGRKGDDENTDTEAPKAGKDTPKGDIFGRTTGEVPASAKTKKEKKGLKEYFNSLDKAISEMGEKPFPVLDQGNKQAGVGVVKSNNPTVQNMLNQLKPNELQVVMKGQQGQQQSGTQPMQQPMSISGGATNQPMAEEGGENWIQKATAGGKGKFAAKAAAAGKSTAAFAKEKAHAPGKLGKEARLAQTLSKMRHKKTNEGDIPPQDGLLGAGLGAGRSQGVAEAKKPDANNNGIPDYAEDGKGKNDLKKKTKVKESMDNRLKAAHHAGKAHGLSGHAHSGKNYDDMEEARMYHEGYKEGLDECYGQVPIQGLTVADESAQGTVDDMASFGAHTPALEGEMDEGNAFTKALAKTPKGGKFSVAGTTFTDTSNYDSKVFESWDNQLSSLLEEYQEIQEGISVSVSKGQQGAPDSVSVTAQDGDADKLLQIVKHAGLGLFGDEGQPADVGATPAGAEQHGGVDVVGDHDGMMALIKKSTGDEQPGTLEPTDAEGEEGDGELDMIKQLTQAIGGGVPEQDSDDDESEEGSAEEEVEEDEEQIGGPSDETSDEYMNQEEEQVAEDNPPDTGAAEFQAMDAEVAADNSAASSHGGAENSNLEEEACDTCGESKCQCDEEQVEESYANSDDDGFQADIDFMTKMISGGLNKQKSTGQTTIPVIAGQDDRMGYSVKESVSDWKKLAGI